MLLLRAHTAYLPFMHITAFEKKLVAQSVSTTNDLPLHYSHQFITLIHAIYQLLYRYRSEYITKATLKYTKCGCINNNNLIKNRMNMEMIYTPPRPQNAAQT